MTLLKNNNHDALVSIIIVNWNGLKWLKDCLPTLAKQTYKSIEIILVDNASDDASVTWIKKNFPHVAIISSRTNKGFADANNIGFDSAKGEYILFLNNDTRATPTFVEELVQVFTHDGKIGGVQSKLLLMDDTSRLDSIGAFLTPTGFLYHYGFMNRDKKEFDREINLYTAKGAAMMFKRSVLDMVKVNGKLFDPDYFAYFEETDLCHRVWLAGFKIVYGYKAIIFHKMGGTSTTMDNAYIQYHSFKNRICTYLKNLEVINLLTILPFHLLCCQFFACMYLLRGKLNVSLAVQKAILWNLIHLRSTWQKRMIIQRSVRKVHDKQYFPFIYKTAPLAFYISQIQGIPYER
jgi:GT2 family glycosyltransferase